MFERDDGPGANELPFAVTIASPGLGGVQVEVVDDSLTFPINQDADPVELSVMGGGDPDPQVETGTLSASVEEVEENIEDRDPYSSS